MSTWDFMSDVDRQHMRDAGRDEGGRHLGARSKTTHRVYCDPDDSLGLDGGGRWVVVDDDAIASRFPTEAKARAYAAEWDRITNEVTR